MLPIVVLSTDDNPLYKEFWPIVRKAWKLCFPEIAVKLAYVSDKPDMMIPFHEDVYVLPIVPGIPIPNQSKLARIYLASQYNEQLCMINDIDLIPLSRFYVNRLMSYRKPGTFTCVGGDLYAGTPDDGKFPMGYFMAEGQMLRELFNPKELNWKNFIMQFAGFKKFDSKEDITNTISNFDPNCFSDESLTRALLHDYPNQTKIHRINRSIDEHEVNTIDRSNWRYDQVRLAEGKYWQCHALRPYSKYKHEIDFLMKFLERIYGQGK